MNSENTQQNMLLVTEEKTGCRCLLVDDIPSNLQVLSAILQKLVGPPPPKTASSAQEAIEELQSFEPDVIMTDLWMPGMNGEELTHALKNENRFKRTCFVAVTADKDAQARFDLSIFDYVLYKPISIAQLRSIINEIVSGNPPTKQE